MFEEQIETIESFKIYKISALIDKVTARIFDALRHPDFNPEVASYFNQINKEGQPFTDFELDPDNVSQIKKVLNALYYARITFSDVENVNLKKDWITSGKELMFLYNKTVNDAYEACFLLTHLDVDIQEMFKDEFQMLIPVLSKLATLETKSSEIKGINDKQAISLSYTIGEVTGTAIEQMHPSSGNLDYTFLTTFSATLPSYIDKITQYIQQYSSQMIGEEPTLNNKRLEELQNTSLGLLNDLETLRGANKFYASLKFLKYIYIIRNIITLANSSLEQMGYLNESSQNTIRDNLAQLKYKFFPELFGLVDKIEVNCMLKPGALSSPLMEKVKSLYQTLIYYASKPVDFKAKGEELLSIEDAQFLNLRLEKTYQRIDKAYIEKFKLEQTHDACNRFFQLLNKQDYKNLALHELPTETITQLTECYKIISPLMTHIDAKLNQQIIDVLLDQKKAKPGYLMGKWLSFTGALPDDHLKFILATQQKLFEYIKKKQNTQDFHITLNTNLIKSVREKTNLILFPYSDTTIVITTEEIEKITPPPFPEETKASLYSYNEKVVLETAGETNSYLHFTLTDKNTTIANPEQLSADQSLLLYQWYKNKLTLLQDARNAYDEFNSLLENQIKEHYPIPSHALSFNPLKPEIKKQCYQLYKRFRVHLQQDVPAGMQILLQKFDAYLNVTDFSESSQADAPILVDFKKVQQHFQKRFDSAESTLKLRTQFYLKKTKHKYASEEQNVFIIDELRALRNARALTSELRFTKGDGKKEVANPEQLSANQAFILHQWYVNKLQQFQLAQKAYIKFTQLLEAQAPKYPSAQSTQLTINKLDKEVKVECRKLYNLFQPYFINGIPTQMKGVALAFDKYLVSCLAEKEVTSNTPTLYMFEKLNGHFETYFGNVNSIWAKKSENYLALAQKQCITENSNAKLAYSPNANRASYLLKHTQYSSFLHEFRRDLQERVMCFNQAMQKELAMEDADAIPFPELQNIYNAEAQPEQVLVIKELYNYLYHLEQIIKQLEKLNDESPKTQYVYYLANTYSHLHRIIQLTQKLGNDTYLKLISDELLEKAQKMWATIQENVEPYQESADNVAPLDKKIKSAGLWYALNTFNIIPKHIRSLRNTSHITQYDLNQLHVSAKRAALATEKLIDSSNSYFKLFLQTPKMISLYTEFTSRLTEFISTVHDAASSNLGEFHEHVFTPMLIEADDWEDKLGLAPGTFAEPLRQIINEYYKGLLSPLKLHSYTHMTFVCDKAPITQRIEITQKKIVQANMHLQKMERDYYSVLVLYTLIEQYNKLNSVLIFADTKEIARVMEQIRQAYKIASPKLVSLKRVLKFEPGKLKEEDINFDAHLNASLKSYDKKLTGIKDLVKLSGYHYLGLNKTYTLKLKTAEEKAAYLTQLNLKHDEENAVYLQDYTTQSFDRQSDELVSRHLGLQYVDKEYKAKLTHYLLKFKDNIIKKTKSELDINESIKELLKEKIRHFEQEHFVQYYQLDCIRVALAQFKNYFSLSALAIERKKSFYEDDDTLKTKTAAINKLVDIAENELLSIDERVKQIKLEVTTNPNFARVILEQKKVDHFSFTYLVLCFLTLLEALHLYTPNKNARLRDLKKAINQEPKISDLTSRFGLFTQTNPANPERPPEAAFDEDEPEPDAPAPTY